MKLSLSLFVAPAVIFLSACSTHYAVSSHHGHNYGHRGHVSVGVHGHSHGNAGAVLGALVVGGVIGHMISEASEEHQDEHRRVVVESQGDDTDTVVNGYEIDSQPSPEPVNSRWYQLGKDGKCYLMESENGRSQIVSLVPNYSCN